MFEILLQHLKQVLFKRRGKVHFDTQRVFASEETGSFRFPLVEVDKRGKQGFEVLYIYVYISIYLFQESYKLRIAGMRERVS